MAVANSGVSDSLASAALRRLTFSKWAKMRPAGMTLMNVTSHRTIEIGRASCRERVYGRVYISVVAVSLKKKIF